MRLIYKAVTRDGRSVRGLIEAKDIAEAAFHLRSRELIPIRIIPKGNTALLSLFPFLKKSSHKDLVFFTQQLSSLIASGLTLMQSLVILRDQVENETMADVVSSIIKDIEEGKTFSSALLRFPDTFSPIYISLIKASETSGLLDKILLRLSENLEKQTKLKDTIKSALMYPAIVVSGMIVVVIIMMIFVVPQLSVLYENLNIPLPLPTQIIVGISNFTINFWPLVLVLAFSLSYAFRRWHKTEAGKFVLDGIVLRLPIFGKLTRQAIQAEFTRTFGLLVGSGTLVVEALNQSADVMGNMLYRNAVRGVAQRVERGVMIGDALSSYPLFSLIVVQMVKIGEQTGKLDESLMKVSEYFEREVEQLVKTLTTAMEPIIMVVLGIGVAFLIISIITPIYNLTSTIQ